MKTFVPFKKSILKFSFFAATVLCTSVANSQSVPSLKFDNPVLQSGTALQAGATYLFSNVQNNVDAVVSIDSLINGAKINKIDDNSNGLGYKDAFQPAVQSGGVIGMSYAVFTIKFYIHNTTTTQAIAALNATSLDLDGNSTLKEFSRVNVGNGGLVSYLTSTLDISVLPILNGDFMAQNVLGIERNGIDTSALANMFTASNTNISSFTIKFGTLTVTPSSSVRQFSMYMKPFNYVSPTLPVKLSSFTATLNKNDKVDLRWSTASEINTSHFVVERSTDGNNYGEAGVVFAYGNATDNTNYIFPDNLSGVTAPIVYYRLRSVDVDGKGQYSETRMVRLSKQSDANISILAFPNPVTNELRIGIPNEWQNKKVIYEVLNMSGQVTQKTEAASGSQIETINVANLARGFYMVRVSCEGQAAQQKIVKQ
ncbi:MAG: T9SS type A sorting domain-containing protein [Chitinophagaceae bacterium]|nr:T9SS type A sorting domain-containing protein [Chitinophagaceae bacterium]